MGKFYRAAGVGPIQVAPASVVAPTQSGTATLASTLTCDPGRFSGWPKPKITYQWIRDTATDVAGATEATRVIAAADQTHTLKCKVTASNDLVSAEATTAATGVIP
jgi:hypothetical protein